MRRGRDGRRRRGVATVAVLTALVVAESWSVPLPLNENSTDYKQSGLAPLPGTLAIGSADARRVSASSRSCRHRAR